MLDRIQIVLVCTTHAGNIGAVARAMKNMGLTRLVLVTPRDFPSEEATARASGADDVLAAARVVETLPEAVANCELVVGASARRRSVQWQQLDARATAQLVARTASLADVAIVFGRESSGLSNDELDHCSHLLHIPTNPDYASLNVAMAVQVVTYELRMAAGEDVVRAADGRSSAASAHEMEGLFAHMEQALDDIGFLEAARGRALMRRLRRLFYRAAPDSEEVNILRGILSAAQGRKSMRPRKQNDI